jgi:hypothetical protein
MLTGVLGCETVHCHDSILVVVSDLFALTDRLCVPEDLQDVLTGCVVVLCVVLNLDHHAVDAGLSAASDIVVT